MHDMVCLTAFNIERKIRTWANASFPNLTNSDFYSQETQWVGGLIPAFPLALISHDILRNSTFFTFGWFQNLNSLNWSAIRAKRQLCQYQKQNTLHGLYATGCNHENFCFVLTGNKCTHFTSAINNNGCAHRLAIFSRIAWKNVNFNKLMQNRCSTCGRVNASFFLVLLR
jgi:hypothetical protein